MLVKGEAITIGIRDTPLSTANSSDDIKEMSFPELVSMSDFILSWPTLSKSTHMRVFLIFTANLYPKK